MEIIGSIGLDHPVNLTREHVFQRVEGNRIFAYSQIYPEIEANSLLSGTAPPFLQKAWKNGHELLYNFKTE